MAEENVVIAYRADISDISRKVRSIQRINRAVAQNIGKDFSRGLRVVSSQLDQIKTVGRDIKLPFGGSTNQVQTFTTVLKNANGQLVTVRETVAGTGKNIKVLNQTVSRGNKGTRTFGENLATLAKRAALTIPVWFAIRNGIGGITRTVRDGISDILSFDRALQKLRRNIQATSTDVETDFSRVREEIEKFSLRTGRSVEDVTNAVQRFATVGFDIETALQGGLRSTQLAVTLFGEAEQTANAFARSLRVLTEGIDDPAEKQREIAEALALTDQLWQTNAFEVNEFSNNLEKFAGTARASNISIRETLTLLATLSTGGLGERGGRLLRTTVLRSIADFENINRQLDLDLDPKQSTTVEFILAMIDALKDLGVTGNQVPAELGQQLADLFSVRSTEPIAALVALEDTLKENIALIPDLEKFDQTLEDILDTPFNLAEQFTNLNREIGKSFVTGLVGADNFDDALQRIVKGQRTLLEDTENFGGVVRDVFLATGAGALTFFIRKIGLTSLSITALTATIARLRALALAPIAPIAVTAILAFEVLRFKEQAESLAREAESRADDFEAIGASISQNIQKGLNRKLSLKELNDLIIQLETFGGENIGFDNATIERSLDLLKEIRDTEREITEEKEKQIQKTEDQEVAESKRKQLAELALQTELDILKARGATASQIIEAEQAGRKQLDIQKDILGQVEDQLNKEKELTEERRLRANVGNESLKLFRIAQTEGTEVARVIGEVLAGQRDFNTFVRKGGKELEVFKNQFGDVFESQQAERFFRGDIVPGLRGLRGGSTVPTEERFDRDRGLSDTTLNLIRSQERAERLFLRFTEEQNKNTTSSDSNTEALQKNTASINTLRHLFEAGAPLRGQDAERFLQAERNREFRDQNIRQVALRNAPRQSLNVNLNVNGRNLRIQGTSDLIEQFAREVGEEAGRQVQQLVRDINDNPQSPGAQAVRKRILEE